MNRTLIVTGLLSSSVALMCAGCRAANDRSGVGPTLPPPPADFYVATNGNDAWSGQLAAPDATGTDGPFHTLDRARDEIRKLKAAAPAVNKGITVIVRGGIYTLAQTFTLDAQDSGTADAPIVYRATPGETVILAGGPTLPPDVFKPLADASVRDRLIPAARDHVVQADLRTLGITELGTFPVKFQGVPQAPELFFNDQRLTLARWPNDAWATIAKIVEVGSIPRTGDKGTVGGVFEYSGDAPSRWNVDAGVWLHGYWCFDWYAEVIQVKAIDRDKRQITLAAPSVYGVKQGNPSPRRYYAMNLLEELDRPGEYFIDRDNGRLYFWPPGPLADARIVLSTLKTPVVATADASHIVLRGFTVEASLGHGMAIAGGTAVHVQACEVRNTRELGIHVNGGTAHRVEACDVHDTGTGGITLAGGDRKTLTPAGHEAVNNHIWRFSNHKLTYSNALMISGVGNRAAHNLIHDAPHQAIGIGGNDHIFEYNVVHHICMETDDCGAYYKGRNPSCRGNIIRYNFWHNIGSPMGHGNAAVYFDDGDGGDFVIGNVFFRCGDPGKGSFGTVFSHGGHDLLAENNVFIECKRALGSSPWNDKRWRQALAGTSPADGWQGRLLKEVDITQPPYTTRYPALVGYMDPPPDQVRVNRALRNVIAMCADVKSGNWQVDETENWITDKDPGFVNAAKGDFRLKPNSEVFKRLPGFEPIPFEKMGLIKDELRPNPRVEAWTYDPPKPLPPLLKRPAGAPPKPKTGVAPVFTVARATAPVTIDGNIDPAEWNTADSATAMLLAQDVGGNPAPTTRQSRAWLTYDETALYIAVDSAIHPDTKLDGNQWGANDAVEIAVRTVRQGKTSPIAVVRGYGNGFLQFGTATSGADDPKSMEPAGTVFKTTRPEPGRWTAEFRIPFAMLDMDPAADTKAAFSLTVRKSHDNLWLMWEGTRAHSYDVSQAGFIELLR